MFLKIRFLILGLITRLLCLDKVLLLYYCRTLTVYQNQNGKRHYTLGRLNTIYSILDLLGFSKRVEKINDRLVNLKKVE